MSTIKLYSLLNFLQWWVFDKKERITGFRHEKRKFRQKNGYALNLKNPLSFSEKIVWKKLYDRNPLLPIVSDKYRVRQYLKDVLGQKQAEEILIPLLYVTDRPETIPFDNLGQEYIIKPNHASHKHIIIEKNSVIDRKQIIAQCRKWLSKPYGLKGHEWAYQSIKRKIVIEKLLRDENGNIPFDYCFFIIHGKCHLIRVIHDNFTDKKLAHYTPAWDYLKINKKSKLADYQPKPENLDSMLNLAETLGVHFDSIRVDLYRIKNKIYFGELTNYNCAGYASWAPDSYNFELGAKWKITERYWKQDNYILKTDQNSFKE